jgi:hypothetical protein
MFSKSKIETIYSIFKQITPNLIDSIQVYDKSQTCRLSHLVQFEKDSKIVDIWLDFKELNQWKLKFYYTNINKLIILFSYN